jgi:hypothetical protein
MRKYKIVEMKDGHGNSKFRVRGLHGLWIFKAWCDWGILQDTMKEATDRVEEYINEEKNDRIVKVKEYIYTTVPNHVPEGQVGKFMEINLQKK